MGDASEIYPLARDSTESSRLNEQHNFIVQAVDGLFDSSLPLENISAVADVGTGTGIWLLQARDFLDSKFPGTEENRTFHGFDISSEQFPQSTPDNVSFSLHNVLKPFPPEYHGKYDLVYVRLLVAAVPESEYEIAVRNLVEILKPGGYIQWTDINSAFLSSPTNDNLTDPRCSFFVSTWLDFLKTQSLAIDAPASLAESFKRVGLSDVRNIGYAQHDRGERFKIRAQKWQAQSLEAVVRRLVSRNGEADVKRNINEEIKNLWEYFGEDGGRVLALRLGVVVGRKAA
ncbi:class I SAM-dependent methyltransferase [Aspergillus mulundensis]|uniref:Methyltransferase domain-containing protein n=1 Tax=Aspergillus mulundensis TaxID=1810919 RepID=A0A3D8SJQ4_9EURO|nr:hypothetical protein DSM5745_03207 [Aspergillus mulundensis]RDW86565.1 hypothetical protein DSM5745_03207 [Aspergillus mulundensis]